MRPSISVKILLTIESYILFYNNNKFRILNANQTGTKIIIVYEHHKKKIANSQMFYFIVIFFVFSSKNFSSLIYLLNIQYPLKKKMLRLYKTFVEKCKYLLNGTYWRIRFISLDIIG